MSKFFTKAFDELLELKGHDIVDYFSDLSFTQRKSFFLSHRELFKTSKYFKRFVERDRFDLIRPFIEMEPAKFAGLLVKHNLKIGIETRRSSLWSQTERKRVMTNFHYQHPELTHFLNGADVRAWLKGFPKDAPFSSLRYVLKEVVPHHATNPAAAFGSIIRSALRVHHIEEITDSDYDLLLSDGDTLLNELFSQAKFKEYIKNDMYPSKAFVNIVELNCTMSAMEKDRTSRHGKRVAKNLKRAKLLTEIKDVS